jgi:hypothetical protein
MIYLHDVSMIVIGEEGAHHDEEEEEHLTPRGTRDVPTS